MYRHTWTHTAVFSSSLRARSRGHLGAGEGPSGRIPRASKPTRGAHVRRGPLARRAGAGRPGGQGQAVQRAHGPRRVARHGGEARAVAPPPRVVRAPRRVPALPPRQGVRTEARGRRGDGRGRRAGRVRRRGRPGPRPLALLRHARRLVQRRLRRRRRREEQTGAPAAVGRLQPGAGPARRRLLRVPGPGRHADAPGAGAAARLRRGLRRHGRRRLPLLGRPPADAPPRAARAAGPGAGLLRHLRGLRRAHVRRGLRRAGPRPGAVRRQPALRRVPLGRRRDGPLEPGAPRGEGPRRRPG